MYCTTVPGLFSSALASANHIQSDCGGRRLLSKVETHTTLPGWTRHEDKEK